MQKLEFNNILELRIRHDRGVGAPSVRCFSTRVSAAWRSEQRSDEAALMAASKRDFLSRWVVLLGRVGTIRGYRCGRGWCSYGRREGGWDWRLWLGGRVRNSRARFTRESWTRWVAAQGHAAFSALRRFELRGWATS